MSAPALWKTWEGRVVDGKFPLRQSLGSSDCGAVFLTETAGKDSQKAAIKILSARNLGYPTADAEAQISRWAAAMKLSHPHLMRILEYGHSQLDDTKLLYVVTEFAEENLAEILPLRPLAPAEVADMLQPAAEALAYLHNSGFVHGRIKPSNILAAADQLKISADSLRKAGERGVGCVPSLYDAPEIAATGPSAPADIWSLGMTLLAVLTQREPKTGPKTGPRELESIAVPETIPSPLREIVRRCLQTDPKQRCTADEILSQLRAPVTAKEPVLDVPLKQEPAVKKSSRRWVLIPVIAIAIFLSALLASKFIGHQAIVPAADTRPANPAAEAPATPAPAPFSENKKPAEKGPVKGSVLQQVLPEVSRSAQHTITGRLKVSVQVSVDASGNVSQAKLVSAGPSRYFASHALEAARRWHFNPPQVDGEAVTSEWLLRFQFGRSSTQVFPSETKP